MPTTSTMLPRVLLFDAATCVAMGLGLALAAEPLAPVLGLPATLLRGAGLVLLPFAAALIALARSASPSAAALYAVVAANLAWALASVALVVVHLVLPTSLGMAFLLAQALAVAGLAALELAAFRLAAPREARSSAAMN